MWHLLTSSSRGKGARGASNRFQAHEMACIRIKVLRNMKNSRRTPPSLRIRVVSRPADAARELFAEIVLGLEELHSISYLYCDAGHLLLLAPGHIRLVDLGLVKRLPVWRCGSECSASGDAARLSVSSEVCTSDGAELLLSRCSSDEGDSIVRLLARTHIFVGTRR